jgi:hypothetical protein
MRDFSQPKKMNKELLKEVLSKIVRECSKEAWIKAAINTPNNDIKQAKMLVSRLVKSGTRYRNL